ncbi:aggrecan core protein-like [Ruditapes philippinarum]|uniref:aggrecan core protein-like n=1 Tax=Ruditapes philippinarum TaxID=129788 RepID=UPI00295C33C9|nr:aggrecan core protein-like [Ruditapes philippinarum]
MKLFILCVVTCVLRVKVYADYDCLCNYRVETPLFGQQNENSSPVAYMYEFDCKPAISKGDTQETWFAVMNEHAVAYVHKDSGLQVQLCAGSIPSEDKLFPTTLLPVTSTASTTQLPTSASTREITATMLKTTTTVTSKKLEMTTSTTEPSTRPSSTFKPQTTRSTSTQTTKLSTLISTPFTNSATTKAATRTTQRTTQDFTSQPTASWTRTTDWLIHWNITHQPYTTEYPHTKNYYHSTKKPHHYSTDWLIHWNVTHPPFTTDYYQTSYHSTYSHGNLNLCPGLLRRSVDHTLLRQYGNHCYELVHTSKNWHGAENDCWNRIGHGGELLEIYTEDIQNYIMNFLREVNNQRYLWIGLEDIDREEHFMWDSGTKVTYTNWTPNRKSNHLPHGQEDCV